MLLPVFFLILTGLFYGAQSRVVGGSTVDIADHPWQISLRVQDQHSCGASLVSAIKAVTAAHCVGGAIQTYSVLAGSSVRTSTECETCYQRSLTSFVRHASYLNEFNIGFPNDIGVFRFASIPTNAHIGFATMAASNAGNFAGQTCVITGWGRALPNGPLPLILQEGSGTILSNAACVSAWTATQINNGHICFSSSTVSGCQGDNGGPVVCGGVLVGAMSWTSPECNPGFPTVASRISFFRSWIDSN